MIRGKANHHISAGNFDVDLLQGRKYIKKALTNSWAEHCGVNLQDNPELKKNLGKFLKGEEGAMSSEIP